MASEQPTRLTVRRTTGILSQKPHDSLEKASPLYRQNRGGNNTSSGIIGSAFGGGRVRPRRGLERCRERACLVSGDGSGLEGTHAPFHP